MWRSSSGWRGWRGLVFASVSTLLRRLLTSCLLFLLLACSSVASCPCFFSPFFFSFLVFFLSFGCGCCCCCCCCCHPSPWRVAMSIAGRQSKRESESLARAAIFGSSPATTPPPPLSIDLSIALPFDAADSAALRCLDCSFKDERALLRPNNGQVTFLKKLSPRFGGERFLDFPDT